MGSYGLGEGATEGVFSVVNCIILQVNIDDRWMWNLESSKNCNVNDAYNFHQQSVIQHIIADDNLVFWHKVVPLKVNIFAWCLFLDRLPTKNILFKQWVFLATSQSCAGGCGNLEGVAHLFLHHDFFDKFGSLFRIK